MRESLCQVAVSSYLWLLFCPNPLWLQKALSYPNHSSFIHFLTKVLRIRHVAHLRFWHIEHFPQFSSAAFKVLVSLQFYLPKHSQSVINLSAGKKYLNCCLMKLKAATFCMPRHLVASFGWNSNRHFNYAAKVLSCNSSATGKEITAFGLS